jgi:uridine kinase
MEMPFLVGVAGGTGSGKTTVSERLAGYFGPGNVALIKLDAYYADRPDLTLPERAQIDYDHPDAFDWALFTQHLRCLAAGKGVAVPVYDFADYARVEGASEFVAAASVVVVEGILVLYEPAVRSLCDLKVYVDTDADVRFIRRLSRDVAERGRTAESVIEQYLATVRPSHLQFVEPSKRYADVIIPHGGMNAPAIDVLLARMRELLA